jgi:hypothetical protein
MMVSRSVAEAVAAEAMRLFIFTIAGRVIVIPMRKATIAIVAPSPYALPGPELI